MRKLVILRGAPGVGKSTFIKSKNLEDFTLSSDKIRLMFNSLEMTLEYREVIPQFNNQKVWELLYYILEERMKKGEFTIVDAVHASKEDFTTYKHLAEKYRYRLYVVDFSNIPKEKVYAQNERREDYKVVPKYSIDNAYKKFAREKVPNSFKIIEPENFDTIFTNVPRDFNVYKNIHIIGDIHGCFSVLKSYFEKYPLNEDDAYIFLGDYFDRGIENFETYNFLKSLMDKENAIFLIGNHEDKLYKYACSEEYNTDLDIEKTILDFEKNKVQKSEIRGFIKHLSQIAYISFRDKTYIINHGGIPYFPTHPLDFCSTNSFIYGIGNYEDDIDEKYEEYMSSKVKKIYQVHGHRNYHKRGISDYKYSYNLDGNVENGGALRILNLNDDGTVSYTTLENKVYNLNLKEETDVYNLVKLLRKSKYVLEKNLTENISSFNFTKEAFYNHAWNFQTTKARGLFIDTKLNKIVARSYDKFFNLGERVGTSLEDLKDKMTFPVKFFLKYNGFLGILSSVDGELFFASKSTNTGDYVDYFKNIFYELFDEKQIECIKKKILEDNVSFIFEVIDPINDAHIIKYNEAHLVLLDIIYNSTEFKMVEFEDLEKFGKENNMEVKKLGYVAHSKAEINNIIDLIVSENYTFNGDFVEGFVLQDSTGFMIKIKTAYYIRWKVLRGKMEKLLKTGKYNTSDKTSEDEGFLYYIKNKYEKKDVDWKQVNIISEREEFYRKENMNDK